MIGLISEVLQRFLLLWLLLSSWLSLQWPSASAALPVRFRVDPFLITAPYLPWLIAITMFAIGLMLPRDEVNQLARRGKCVFGGTLIQYTVMPLLAFAMGRIWQLEGDYFVGIIMVGCVPGAMASNVLTLNARGNTSYSVSLTTMATLLSPFVVPVVMRIALSTEESVTIDPLRTSSMLALTVVGPVITGHAVARLWRQGEPMFRVWGARTANLAILWIISVVVGLNRAELMNFRIDVVAALLSVNVVGYVVGYLGGTGFRLPEPMRRALTLEVGMQNAGLGATLATQLFPDRHAIAIAPALYTFGCMVTGTMLAHGWARASGVRNDSNGECGVRKAE